jgi:hypothetical protein
MKSTKDLLEYLQDYNNCINYCGNNLDDPKVELDECVKDLKKDFKSVDICNKALKECEIIHSDKFNKLMIFLINFLKFFYYSRSIYGNKYDQQNILVIGGLNLEKFGLTIEDLSCVRYPGDDSYAAGFPKTLSEYLTIMNKINTVIKSGKLLNKDALLKKYKPFCDDFQPWSRTLSTFINIYGQEIKLLKKPIPPIEKIENYGSFIKKSSLDKFSPFMTAVRDPSIKERLSKGFLKRKKTRKRSRKK